MPLCCPRFPPPRFPVPVFPFAAPRAASGRFARFRRPPSASCRNAFLPPACRSGPGAHVRRARRVQTAHTALRSPWIFRAAHPVRFRVVSGASQGCFEAVSGEATDGKNAGSGGLQMRTARRARGVNSAKSGPLAATCRRESVPVVTHGQRSASKSLRSWRNTACPFDLVRNEVFNPS